MSTKEKLLKKALENPQNLTFEEFQNLFENYGFIKRKGGGGSHFIYKRSEHPRKTFSIQEQKGKAKPYQVHQFLNWAEDNGLIIREEVGRKKRQEEGE